jgi:hypothetical protein
MWRAGVVIMWVFSLAWPWLLSAQNFTGAGPLPARNFQPIQQIFLNLPFESARVLEPGAIRLRLESAESNEIATEQGSVEATLKFEQNRTVIGGSLGVLPGWEIGIDLPFLSRFGGFLDPPIDTIEDLFGANNPERKMYPNNSFGGYTVSRNGTLLFNGKKQYLELGDLWVSSKYLLWQPEGGPLLSLRGAIKAPTGRTSSVWGSGKPDFGLGLAADYQPLRWLVLYGNVNLVYPVGPITPARLTLDPIVTQAVAFEAGLGWGFSALFQQQLYTSPFHGNDTPVLDGTVVELALGVNWRWQGVLVQLGGIQNVSGVAQAADFTLLLRLVWEIGAGYLPGFQPSSAQPSV